MSDLERRVQELEAEPLSPEERVEIQRSLFVMRAQVPTVKAAFDRYEATIQALEAENAELKAELDRLNAQADEKWLRDLDEGFPRTRRRA